MLTGRGGTARMDDVAVVVTGSSSDHRRRRKGSSGHVVAQLLESPLPTPRRSCSGRSAETPPAARRGCRDASPQRGHVPFKWESSPGVPKTAAAAAAGGKAEREVPLPKPPPGRCGGTCHAARARAYHLHHSNTTDSGSSDRQDDDDTFSDALGRVSSSDRLAALSARLSAIDGAVFGSRSRRSPSFIMDRFLPAANAIATTSADKHPRRPPSPRRSSKSKRDTEAETEAVAAARARLLTHIRRRALAFEQPKQCQREEAAAAHAQGQLSPCAKEEAESEDTMTPRACGLVFFVPWSAKPVLLGFQRSPARYYSRTPPRGDVASVTTTASSPRTTPRGDVASVTTMSSSPPRRSVTLGDVLEIKDRRLRDGGLSQWDDEKSGSGKEWANPGWGMALLGTSKRYCADARKALSRLTRSGMDGGGDSPRIGRERSSSKHKQQAASVLRSTSVEMPPLSPPSESWLSNARRSNAGSHKS